MDAETSRREGYGIGLVRVHGEFLRTGKGKLLRTNPLEASAIVEEIARRFEASPDELPSIGVVTFNMQQRAYIEALIRDGANARMIEALESPREGLFVKNLENVQGDERDVIFFSTGFSVNDKGILPLNFGPLIQSGGERRLNVAVTRARREVLIFTSFEPMRLRADETTNQGLKDLRAYLELADSGTHTLESSRLRRPARDLHREDVAAALRERGFVVDTGVGLSDFRIDLAVARADQPQRYLAAIQLDGPEWGARATIGDRDSLPVEVLQGLLHWPVVSRVWLPAWLSDRERVLEQITGVLEGTHLQEVDASSSPSAVDRPSASAAGLADPAPGMLQDRAPSLDDLGLGEADDPWGTVLGAVVAPGVPTATPSLAAPTMSGMGRAAFVPWKPSRRGGRDELDALAWSAAARSRVRQVAVEIFEHEHAIHEERLVKLLATDFDLSRVNAARSASILEQVPSSHRRGDERAILWSASAQPTEWVTARNDESASRPVEHSPLREISHVMAAVCTELGGVQRQELLRESLASFGMRRLTQGVESRMVQALAYAVAEGVLVESRGVFRAVALEEDAMTGPRPRTSLGGPGPTERQGH